MSTLEEKLNSLKKKKLTAKTIVEQQRTELRILKSTGTLNERLEDIFRRFIDRKNINENLYRKIVTNEKEEFSSSNERIHRAIEDLTKLIEQILNLLSIDENLAIQNEEFESVLKKQKEIFQLIKWKLSDIYANRIADEVSCITS